VIPLLSKLQQARKVGIRAMMLAPTRELADQIYRETSRLCHGKRIQIGLVKKSVVTSAALDGKVIPLTLLLPSLSPLLELIGVQQIRCDCLDSDENCCSSQGLCH
jgi:aromatic ring-opening dioxygenase LigB subunit